MRFRALSAAIVLAVPLPLVARAADDVADPQVFSVEVLLAPVAVDGTFPLTIDLGGTPLVGTLHVDTDVRGKLAGTLDVASRTFAVKGAVSHGTKGTHASFTATDGADRISFSGSLSGTTLTGRATGKGAVAAGRHDFALNLATAEPETALVECSVSEAKKGRLTGTARVTACGDTVDLAVAGKSAARTWSLSLKAGRNFRFSGKGPPAAEPTLGWSAKGFGAKTKGAGLALATLAPPAGVAYGVAFAEFEIESAIAPLVPTSGPAPRETLAIAPSLPEGLQFAADGTISGTPAEIRDTTSYTVTATNFAGATATTLDLRTRIPRARSFAPETRTLTDDDVRHFLTRTQFGVTRAEMDRVRSLGLDTFLDDMLVFAQNGPAEAIAAPELLNGSDPVGLEGQFPSQTQLARWWSSLMMNTDNPFQERLAFFWHDHFAASSDVLAETGTTHFMIDYVNLYRTQGNGNLRTLLLAMARDPCMLMYLSGYQNTRTAPNENFAREFWELFTLGVDNGYTQADIVQAAKAFTGWKTRTDATTGYVTMVFDPNRHDTGPKTFLGQTVPGQSATDDFQAVVDVTLDHAPVAEFITTKIFEHFGYDAPPRELVDAMAADLRGHGYDLGAFLKDLFRSEAFFSAASRRSLVKDPVDFTMGFMQTTGLRIQVSTLTSQLTTLAQVPTQPPSVNGWPLGDLWLSAQNMTDRMNAVYLVVEDTTRQNNAGMNVANVLPPVAERTPENVVDTLAALMRVDLTADERRRAIDLLDTNVTGSASNPVATPSPFDGASQSHLDTRVRSLLYILAQHPSYQVR